MDRKKNRVADAVTMNLWASEVPEQKMPDFNGNCEICGTPIHIVMCCDGRECGCMGMPTEPPVCDDPKCYEEYFAMIGKVLERPEETVEFDLEDGLPVFEDELPVFEEELPVFDADPLPVDGSDVLITHFTSN